jgi:hypothetical protein
VAAPNRFAKLSDPGKEAAIAGAIAAGTFEAIPEKTSPAWRVYRSALAHHLLYRPLNLANTIPTKSFAPNPTPMRLASGY